MFAVSESAAITCLAQGDFVSAGLSGMALWIPLAIVVAGLLLGIKDLVRFSLKRTWAISTVCFQQAIRRRVLWITPLIMLGIVIVSQLQKPEDAQDAIRQTIKVCIFATGLLVVLVTIILACTNLPKEIESRVIYTVATKPTTRLEIITGKVLGFARVSAALLLIMGLFTYGFLRYREATQLASVKAALASLSPTDTRSRNVLESYSRGLLTARQFAVPSDVQIYATAPVAGAPHWAAGRGEQSVLIPFELPAGLIVAPSPDSAAGPNGPAPSTVVVAMRIATRQTASPEAPVAPTTAATRPVYAPRIEIGFRDALGNGLVGSHEITPPEGVLVPLNAPNEVQIPLPPAVVSRMVLPSPLQFYVEVTGISGNAQYSVLPGTCEIRVGHKAPDTSVTVLKATADPTYYGRQTMYGQQVRGDLNDQGTVAIYRFHDVKLSDPAAALQSVQFTTGIESSGEGDVDTQASLEFRNTTSGEKARVVVLPDNRRPLYFTVPTKAVAGGNFEVAVRCTTRGHWLALQDLPVTSTGVPWANDRLQTGTGETSAAVTSLRFVQANQSFAGNLFKSLLVLWLMSVLVGVVSIFCSTFLSWPIAVVLTVTVLLGRWVVMQLGDLTHSPGLGRTIVNDLFRGASAPEASVISQTVEGLTKLLNTVAAVLPDISQFAAITDIERGAALPGLTLLASLRVVLAFGLPALVAAYVFLRYKEVAP